MQPSSVLDPVKETIHPLAVTPHFSCSSAPGDQWLINFVWLSRQVQIKYLKIAITTFGVYSALVTMVSTHSANSSGNSQKQRWRLRKEASSKWSCHVQHLILLYFCTSPCISWSKTRKDGSWGKSKPGNGLQPGVRPVELGELWVWGCALPGATFAIWDGNSVPSLSLLIYKEADTAHPEALSLGQ